MGQLTNAQVLLKSLRDKVAAITEPAEKRPVVEALVQSIEVVTEGERRRKTAAVRVTYRFEPASALEHDVNVRWRTPPRVCSRRRWNGSPSPRGPSTAC